MLDNCPALSRWNSCFSRPMLPTTIARPRPKRLVPMIDPVICARTTSAFPAASTNTARISSAMLPKLIFSNPPIAVPTRAARLLRGTPDPVCQDRRRGGGGQEHPDVRGADEILQRRRHRHDEKEFERDCEPPHHCPALSTSALSPKLVSAMTVHYHFWPDRRRDVERGQHLRMTAAPVEKIERVWNAADAERDKDARGELVLGYKPSRLQLGTRVQIAGGDALTDCAGMRLVAAAAWDQALSDRRCSPPRWVRGDAALHDHCRSAQLYGAFRARRQPR